MSEDKHRIKISSRGGTRSGAGRPKGSQNKLSAASLLNDIEMSLGRTFSEQIVQNYSDAIVNQDTALVFQYDKLFLSKVVADKVDVDMRVTEDELDLKRQAFVDALTMMTKRTD